MKIIPIKGAIIPNNNKEFYEYWGLEATAPKDIVLPDSHEDIEIHINSGGGSVFAGSEIYTALKSYPGKKVVKVVGLAASAASVIAMAGDVIEMSPTAQMMIHNVSGGASGDCNTLYHEAEVLENMNKSIANAYIGKTGKPMEDLLALMNKTTWFTAQSAVEAGFADKVMFQDEVVPEFVASVSSVIPQGIIDALSNETKDSSLKEMLTNLSHRLDSFESQLVDLSKKPVAEMTVELKTEHVEQAIQETIANMKVQEKEKALSPFAKFI